MLETSNKLRFYSPSTGYLSLQGLVLAIAEFMNQDQESFYRLVIGSDSQIKHNNGSKEIDFVTAIIIHRQGKGARYFWNKDKVFRAPALHEKIYTETTRSLETAHQLVPMLREAILPAKYDLEIHIDVGTRGPTRQMIREVVGMVQGNGFIAKTKPDSWGASSVADKHT